MRSPWTLLAAVLTTSAAASGAGVVLTPDGSTLFVANPDSGSVSALDTRTLEKTAEVPVGEDPRGLALSRDGRYLFVTCQGVGTLTVLDSGSLRHLGTVRTGAEPYDIAPDASGQIVYVASSASDSISVIELPRRPRRRLAAGRVSASIAVGRRPKGLLLSAGGSHLYATHFLTGEISVIDTERREVTHTISTGLDSNMAQRIALHPNGRAYVPHIRSNTANRFTLFDTTVFPVVSAIDLTTGQIIARERIDLSLGQTAVNLPFDIAFAPGGRFAYVIGLGSGDFSVIDLATRQRTARIEVGDGPRGIAVSPDGRTAYVSNSISGDVSVIDLDGLRETRRISVTTSPLPPEVQRGKALFFSSRSTETSRDRWISCATCHFEGEHDGRTWFTAAGIRNTTSMRGVSDTRPVHWSADRDEVQDFEFTIRDVQAGAGLLRGRAPNPATGLPNAKLSPDLDALAAFVHSLPLKPNPLTHDSEAASRGQAVFERADVGCADCHVPPRFTDSAINVTPYRTHNVGTGDGPDESLGPAFDTPSLRGLWDSAPYLHDGSALTLRDVLTTRNTGDRHGRTGHLTGTEVADLIAFLMSL
jgi:YVTN family beta-propeller protein